MTFNSTVEINKGFRIAPVEVGTSVRAENALVVLQVLRQKPGLSRGNLAKITGLAPSTIGALIHDLLEMGLICESKNDAHKRGRPSVSLRINPDYGYVIGFELGASHISLVTVNLTGRILHEQSQPFDVEGGPQATLNAMCTFVNEIRENAAADGGRLLGIGVAIPSPYDESSATEMNSGLYPEWKNIRIIDHLESETGVPVFMENDANTGALAEKWWGDSPGSTLAYVKVATGVGAGLLFQGELHRGMSGMAGEIGHTVIDGNDQLCRCGLRGCLETHIGRTSLMARAGEVLGDQLDESSTIDDVIAIARSGDERAIQIVEDAGRWLGVAIANLVNLFGPDTVVLGGSLTRADEFLVPAIQDVLRSRTFGLRILNPDIRVSTLGDRAIALGSTTLVFEKAFRTSMIFSSADVASKSFLRSTSSSISQRRRL